MWHLKCQNVAFKMPKCGIYIAEIGVYNTKKGRLKCKKEAFKMPKKEVVETGGVNFIQKKLFLDKTSK